MRAVALVPAAGSGSRLGLALPKPFVPLAGRPILAHTLARLEAVPLVEAVVVVAAEGEIETCRGVVRATGLDRVAAVVPGGAERQDSVRSGLAALPAWADLVLVHDAARPLVPAEVVEAVAREAFASGAATAAVRPKDTVRDDDGRTLDRRRLWLVQTPQGFRRDLLVEAHAAAAADGYVGTDDASLVERLGHPVAVVPGSYRNVKITTREDLVVAEALLAEEARRP
ncbi:MAG TPA: 2-C-methyl-D-erythritol 4-phosphate cytidylyltransferase [Thermodesulfobacteriota bacterium]